MHRPSLLPVSAPVLRLMLGELAGILLTGQQAMPKRLENMGHKFIHNEVGTPLRNLLG
jgi:NAD dependent epimerase/dehydratase family enzyme